MKVVSASGGNIASCLSAARKLLGLRFRDSQEELRSGGEDGLWRVHLTGGVVVECTVIPRSRANAWS